MPNYGPLLPPDRKLYDRAGHQYDPRKLRAIRESLPDVTAGRCRSCQEWHADLGDGLCCACWDGALNTQDAVRRGTQRGVGG